MANPDANTFVDFDAADTPTPPAPTRVAGRYEILGLLGSGGMGTVYRVRDSVLDEVVALKLLKGGMLSSPGAVERFRQEVKLARKVTHPNVVRTFDLGEDADTLFLTMEYVDARPLSWRLDGGPLPEDEIVRIAAAVCDGIGAAHAAGVFHRDLKPDNILVAAPGPAGPGRVAITDFGIAAPRGMTSGLAGTPAYMAPEQVEGREVDGRADVYALGVVLYELATGKRAFTGPDPMAVARARLTSPPPDPRAIAPVSAGLADVIVRCLQREPRQRFASAAEVREALDGLVVRAQRPAAAPTGLASGARGVAVVPFRAAPEDAYLANGLAEELIDLLSVTRGLKVRPFTAVQRVQGVDDPLEIGRRLDVDAVISGALRRSGDGLLITARLVGVADGFQVWGARVACGEGELLVRAEEIASAAAGALHERVATPHQQAAPDDVVDVYLRARHEFRLAFESGRLEQAEASVLRGLALAPNHVGLLSVQGLICARLAFYSDAVDEPRVARGFASARRATELAPRSGEAWLALGAMHNAINEVPEAARALARAVREAPGLARAHDMLGGILLDVGRVPEGLARLETAIALDPIPVFVRADLARAYAYLGDWARADALTQPDPDPTVSMILGEYRCRFVVWSKGRIAPPAMNADQFAAIIAPNHPAVRVVRAMLAAVHDGRIPDDVDRDADEAVLVSKRRLRATICQFLAEMRAVTGREAGVLPLVRLAVEAGLTDVQWMDHCPALAIVRDAPEWHPLREEVARRAARVREALDAP